MRILFSLLTVLTIISCNTTDDSLYKLTGKAANYTDGTKIIVYTVADNNQPKAIDTLTITKEAFLGTYPKTDELTINYLQVENTKGTILFFPENKDLTVTIYKDSIQKSFVTGGQQNDSYRLFSKKTSKFAARKKANSERFKQARKDQNSELASEIRLESKAITAEENEYNQQFVSENPNSLFSVLLLTEMVSRKKISVAEATKIINEFSPKIAATSNAKKLTSLVEKMKKADVGGVAPNFSAPTPDGKTLALNDVLGKYTIIDFWASWCKPCRRENPNVVKVYEKYHDKGLNIISVSLDKAGQKDRWTKAIADDNMNWHHVSNLKGWNDPIAQQYSVRSIPATFLLDEKGNIIAKNLRGNALEQKVASLLGN